MTSPKQSSTDRSRSGQEVARRVFPDHWRLHTARQALIQWLWLVGSALAAIWSVSALDIEWSFLADAHVQAADLVGRMWPPRWEYLPAIIGPLIETVHIATLGTMIAVVLSLPVAFLAARNTTANSFTWMIGRAGFIAKLMAEAIEEVDPGQIEAVRSTGAGTLQTWWVAIIPQVMPVLVGTTIYRWDINVRESSVLGFVGAGGIGLLLYASINQFAWAQVAVVLIAILVIVLASEALSAWVRGRIS